MKRAVQKHEQLLKNLCDNDKKYKQFRNQNQIFDQRMTQLTNYSFFCGGYDGIFSYNDFCFRCKDINALVVVVDCPRMCSIMCLTCVLKLFEDGSFQDIFKEFNFEVCPVCNDICSGFFFRITKLETGESTIVAPENSFKYAMYIAEKGGSENGFYQYLLKEDEESEKQNIQNKTKRKLIQQR